MRQLHIVFHKVGVVEQNLRMLDGVVEVLNQPRHARCQVVHLYFVLGAHRRHAVGCLYAFSCISFIINNKTIDFNGEKIA